MNKVVKALVIGGRYKGETVRVSNVSIDEMGRKNAACTLSGAIRANIPVTDLQVIEDVPEPEIARAKVSMPFVSGSSSSRTLTHTKNMSKPRMDKKTAAPTSRPEQIAKCETCGLDYNLEERKGMPGKLTQCENCAVETENKMEGKMIFSHKTGATIEIKKDGELKHEADSFDYKNNKS